VPSQQLVVLGITWFLVFLFSTTLHEAGHALAALKLGDPTAYQGGQVTLSPLPHVRREPFGMLLVPLISFVLSKGGWMMGWASAPYDPIWAHRHPRRAAIMALAGPAGNLLLVLVAAVAVRVGVALGAYQPLPYVSFDAIVGARGPGFAAGTIAPLSILFTLNLILFVFNLLPVPPLDGSAAVGIFLTDEAGRRYHQFLRQPMFSMLGILAAWYLFGPIFQPINSLAVQLLYAGY